MKFTVDVKENSTTISNDIAKIILKKMQGAFSEATDEITKNLPSVVIGSLKSEPEYNALRNGELMYEFGLTNAVSKVDSILAVWADNIVVEYKPPKLQGYQTVGYYSLEMIKSDYSDVLGEPQAQQLIKNGQLPWLEWLLVRGGDILVQDYEVKFGPSEYSRTGGAIMVESSKNYRVSSKYAGDIGNNWVTRAVTNVSRQIEILITNSLRGKL